MPSSIEYVTENQIVSVTHWTT